MLTARPCTRVDCAISLAAGAARIARTPHERKYGVGTTGFVSRHVGAGNSYRDCPHDRIRIRTLPRFFRRLGRISRRAVSGRRDQSVNSRPGSEPIADQSPCASRAGTTTRRAGLNPSKAVAGPVRSRSYGDRPDTGSHGKPRGPPRSGGHPPSRIVKICVQQFEVVRVERLHRQRVVPSAPNNNKHGS